MHGIQGKRIGVISSIANNPNNDAEINAKFAQALVDLAAGGNHRASSLLVWVTVIEDNITSNIDHSMECCACILVDLNDS